MSVNKTGGHNLPVGLNHAPGIGGLNRADFNNSPAGDGNIGALLRLAGAIYHAAISDNEVVGLGKGRAGEEEGEEEKGAVFIGVRGEAIK